MAYTFGPRPTAWLPLVALSLGWVDDARAMIVFDGPSFRVIINAGQAYTISSVTRAGWTMLDASDCGSCQGTVVRPADGDWLGSCHGGEDVLAVSLSVDGNTIPIAENAALVGNWFQVTKSSRLGEAIMLESSLVVTKRYIEEVVTLEVLDPGLSLAVVYPFLSTHDNGMTVVAGRYDLEGQIEESSTALDNGSQVTFIGADAIMQFDAELGKGVSTFFDGDMAAQGRPCIWDRSCDNKLYFRFTSFMNPVAAGTCWTFRTTRFHFSSDRQDWAEAALVAPFDDDEDSDVDLADIAAWYRWIDSGGMPGSCVPSSPANELLRRMRSGWRDCSQRITGPH